MKSITVFFDNAENVGWTLIHSTWQALIILALVVVALRFLDAKRSSLRYAVACAGLLMILLTSVGTFVYLSSTSVRTSSLVNAQTVIPIAGSTDVVDESISLTTLATAITNEVDKHMDVIIGLWLAGTLLFSLRILSGWWYISRLRSRARIIDNDWNTLLNQLAADLNIAKVIKLAESSDVTSPMVLGYLKPMILIPVGMLSGLTPAQVETIFLHELAHIRRHDYIVNIGQCMIESIFFFNPFVWMLSRIIRNEREFCCDDMVIRKHSNPTDYARALTRLEEVRLTQPTIALPLAGNKNFLLNRIKRIMEKSVKNYSGRDKLIPVALLVVGVICASWLTITSDGAVLQSEQKDNKVAADTVDKRKPKAASYSKRTIITYDENGEPHEEITETFEGDEELRDVIPDMAFDFHMPQMPVVPDMPPMPGFPSFPSFPSFPHPPVAFDFHFDMDTIPGHPLGFAHRNWEAFSEEFEQKFQEQFGDFYKSHGKELEKMMEAFGQRFGNDFAAEWDAETFSKEMKQLQEDMETLSRDLSREHPMEALRESNRFQRDWEEEHREHFDNLSREMEENAVHIQEIQQELEHNMNSFQRELKAELVKDGYIKNSDDVKSINWDDVGEIEVNGVKIKDEHRDKYNRIHRKYFKGGGNFRYVE